MTAPIQGRVDEEVYDFDQDQITDAEAAGKKALGELEAVRKDVLLPIKNYIENKHPGPYVPRNADEEYKILAQRSVDNWVELIPRSACQAMYVDGHRLRGQAELSPAWDGWQRNRLDSRQSWIYLEALTYGQAYAVVGEDESGVVGYDGLAKVWLFSPLDTTALWEDPVNDVRPALVVHIDRRPTDEKPGVGRMWDRDNKYAIEFDEEWNVSITETQSHGCTDTPVIAFVPYRTLSGQPRDMVANILRPQDRINQTNFDLLIAQTYGSFKIRYVTGMVPPPKRSRVNITYGEAVAKGWLTERELEQLEGTADNTVIGTRWVVDTDESGAPIPQPVQMSPKDMVVLENPNSKLGTLDETPLDGYIASKEASVKALAALAQFPTHILTGDIANLSADALAVAEGGFWRMCRMFRTSFGESWEQVLQLIAEVDGLGGADQFDSEVAWTDMTPRAISQIVDALGKGAQMMGIPMRGLWGRFPGVTGGELLRWEQLADEAVANHEAGPEASLNRAISPSNRSWANRGPVIQEDQIGNAP